MKNLVIVESPTKARTIRNFLPGNEYRIEACMGHVRDLPSSAAEIPAEVKKSEWARLGVNVGDDFEPFYIVPASKKKVVRELKAALKDADALYLATDEDREGESIGWHLVEVLQPRIPVRRMVFHEITSDAIQRAIENTRQVDQRLVDAQETRRILDRLVGYTISPLLWKKIAPKLSAGRVQSVAVRLLVIREKERILFVAASYWDLKAALSKNGGSFDADMTHLNGVRLATGRDFDENTGKLKAKNVELLSEERARQLAAVLPEQTWRVASVEERTTERRPYAPFVTSTLQQEANRKLGLSARQTMQVAQRLYEQGLITYMRTDSTNLSKEAVTAARRTVEMRYGKDYLSASARQYATKSKGAQEAHEAIRPAGTEMRTAEELRLSGIEARLYDLIWKRTVASQMAEARLRFTTATIETGEGEDKATFRASGKRVEFPGFFRAYVEGSDDPEAALEDRDQPLPPLKEGEVLNCRQLEAIGHETKPPARFTEATLVKTLEGEGIGRPSTYATIIDTIISRGYVRKQGNQLIPTFTAFATTQLLEQNFSRLVDVNFTATMEQALDDIAAGEKQPLPYLRALYEGDEGLEQRVEEGLDQIDARDVSTIRFPKWEPYVIRVGKFGPYAEGQEKGNRLTASLPDDLAPGDVTAETLRELLVSGNKEDHVLGVHPEKELPIILKIGPYGPYVQLGDDGETKGRIKRTSLPKGMQPEDVDIETAVGLVDLPRTLGNQPDTGEVIKANIGKFGPYVQKGSTYASLKKDDDVLTVDLDRALELFAEKEQKNKPLAVLGTHPETGDPVEVWAGRYGPYVKHGKTNASLPKNADPHALSLEEGLSLLAERAAGKGKRKPASKKKTTRKKSTAKGKK